MSEMRTKRSKVIAQILESPLLGHTGPQGSATQKKEDLVSSRPTR